MAYNTTFTLVDPIGAITMTFYARPAELKIDKQAIVHTEPIAHAGQSVIQNLGHGGYKIDLNVQVYNITTITVTGGTDPIHTVGRLEDWWTDGTILRLTADYLTVRTGAYINCKITRYELIEQSGHQRDYRVKLTLEQFNSGDAI